MDEPFGRRRVPLRMVLDVIATLAMIVAASAITWLAVRAPLSRSPRPAVAVPRELLSIDGAPTIGNADTKVVVIEFSDFQCPFCAKFSETIFPQLKAKYIVTGLVQVAFRHLPLPIHARAQRAAESAVCAGRQQRFWPMHDELFANANRLDEVDLRADAAAVTLNMRQFDSCMRGEAEGLVRQDRELAKSLGLTGTPAFIVGRREEDGRVRATHVLVGAGALADFTRVLDLLLVGS